MKRHIRIGSRGSKLAQVQARVVLEKLSRLHPEIQFEIITVSTTGDQNKEISLEQLGGEGVFVKELEEALLDGRIDMAVHSLKDMPTLIPEVLSLASVTERIDPRDVLVSPLGKLSEFPQGAKIGTGSPRRAVQLLAQRPDLHIAGLRGNIDTRLRKVSAGDYDGIIMAAAALIRLDLEDRIAEYFSPEIFIPAVGQGAIGIEIRANDASTAEMVSLMNNESAWQEVTAERAFMASMGGGCRAPIAALGRARCGMIQLLGMVAAPQGGQMLRAEVMGSASDPVEVGERLAGEMARLGASRLLT
ncbi:MAG: hydroxymethylbilane synthase [Dehalococcoidia bacterium]|nr:hydroxymethylbilane synthase [Dehalococcoidia bacterium]